MLVEIQCDKFISHGKIREPIRFHKGLNAVLGDDNGSNSIGKSTFLMILDFVFGGNDYINKCTDVQTNVQEHIINFTFEFDGEYYRFSRNTVSYNTVMCCDENYNPLSEDKQMTLKSYCAFLSEKYGTSVEEALTWRAAVSRYIRVWKRDTLDEERPLKEAKDESAEAAIKKYMQLFGKYLTVEAQIQQAKEADDEKETFRKSADYRHIQASKNKHEYEDNEKSISILKDKQQQLAEQSNKGLLDLDTFQTNHIMDLKNQLRLYRRQKAKVQAQLNLIRREMAGEKKGFKKTYNELERFFPEAEFQTLERIESFHQKLAKVLGDEFKETEKDLTTTFMMLSNEIVRIQGEIEEIKKIPNVSEAILKEYAQINTELNNLIAANANYDRLKKLKMIASEYAETRDKVIHDQLLAIESQVNEKMKEVSDSIFSNERRMPPVLRMKKLNKYTFDTPNDGGTGAQYRGLVTFDLANLSILPIPFLVHDSPLLKNIEKRVLAEIVRLYSEEEVIGKQVFIAFDMLDTYNEEMQSLLSKHSVLELSPGGNELFGRAWNKETESEKDGEDK